MASNCPRCGAARGSGRYCSSCAYDFWAAAAGREQPEQLSAEPTPSAAPAATATPVPPAQADSPPAVATRRDWSFDNIGLIAVGIALIAAPFLPFISATAAFVGSVSRSGVDMTSGEALLLCVCGLVLGFTGFQRANGGAVRRIVPILAALVASGLTAYYYSQVNDRVQGITSDVGFASIGTGLWLAAGACGLGFLLAIHKPGGRWW